MLCPKCSASVADDSNFCRRCGTPFEKRKGFVANLWRDNKPGFLILSMLLLAMLGSIGYYLSSRTGRFVVTVEKSAGRGTGFVRKRHPQGIYCREFQADCKQRGRETSSHRRSRKYCLDICVPAKGGQTLREIVYSMKLGSAIAVQRFLYRTESSGSWKSESPQSIFKPKLDRLRSAIQIARSDVPFEDKLDYL